MLNICIFKCGRIVCIGTEKLNIFSVCVCLRTWMCFNSEGHATINHVIHCNALKLKKQWFLVNLYSGIVQQEFKKMF